MSLPPFSPVSLSCFSLSLSRSRSLSLSLWPSTSSRRRCGSMRGAPYAQAAALSPVARRCTQQPISWTLRRHTFCFFDCFLHFFFHFVRASTTMCTRHTRTRSRRPQEAILVAPRKRLGGWQLWPWDRESHFLRIFVFFAQTRKCLLATLRRIQSDPIWTSRKGSSVALGWGITLFAFFRSFRANAKISTRAGSTRSR